MKPVIIAITMDTYPGPTDKLSLREAPFASRGLAEAVAACGAVPVMLPDVPGAGGAAYTDMAGGLIIPGGLDMDPVFFGEEPVWQNGRTNYKRDVFEMEMFRAFYEAGKPILGICRGCQLMNIALGGDVYQDLPSQCPSAYIKHRQEAPGDQPTHHVCLAEGSMAARALGSRAYVNSRHHQAIRRVAAALHVTGTAEDGVIEAVESAGGQLLGVQWHPEDLWRADPSMKRLFEEFVRRAGAHGI